MKFMSTINDNVEFISIYNIPPQLISGSLHIPVVVDPSPPHVLVGPPPLSPNPFTQL